MSDSPWAFICSIAYNFHFNPIDVLDMDFANVILFNAALPTYSSKKDKNDKSFTFDKHNQQEIDNLLGL